MKETDQTLRWFRPPRGELAGVVLPLANFAGQDTVMWNLTRGYQADDDVDGVAKYLIEHTTPGTIVDLHDGLGRATAEKRYDRSLQTRRDTELAALPAYFEWLESEGYRGVTVSALVAATDRTLAPPTIQQGPPTEGEGTG